MAKKDENPYEKRKSKSISQLTDTVSLDPNNPFLKNFRSSNTEEQKEDSSESKKNTPPSSESKTSKLFKELRGKPKKSTEAYYLSQDIIDAIIEISKEENNRGFNKSTIVEQILREYLTKHGFLDK